MAIEPGSIDHLTQVISQVVGPSFLLGAVASFIAILSTRMTSVLDRIRALNAITEADHSGSGLKADIPRLRRRAWLLNRAMQLAIAAGIAAGFLILVAFATALIGLQHVWAAAFLFLVSLTLLCAALVIFGTEVRIGLSDHDHH